MSQEVCSDATIRVVRDGEAGHYYVQVGFGDHYRAFAALKTGKLDQLRELAKKEAQSQGVPPPPPQG